MWSQLAGKACLIWWFCLIFEISDDIDKYSTYVWHDYIIFQDNKYLALNRMTLYYIFYWVLHMLTIRMPLQFFWLHKFIIFPIDTTTQMFYRDMFFLQQFSALTVGSVSDRLPTVLVECSVSSQSKLNKVKYASYICTVAAWINAYLYPLGKYLMLMWYFYRIVRCVECLLFLNVFLSEAR